MVLAGRGTAGCGGAGHGVPAGPVTELGLLNAAWSHQEDLYSEGNLAAVMDVKVQPRSLSL